MKNLWKISIVLCLVCCIVFVAVLAGQMKHTYQRYARVFDHMENLTVFEDTEGNLWDSYDQIPEGKYCYLIMDDRGTENINDDRIKMIVQF